MMTILKIKNREIVLEFARVRERDLDHDRRNTVTILTSMSYEEVVALFSAPGVWSVTRKYEPKTDTEGNVVYQEPDAVTDCTEYEKLLCIKDTRTGVLEVVMSKITAEEALAELKEVLNG